MTKPGFGDEDLHLRQHTSQLLGRLGSPTKRSLSSALREYWLYPEQGIECIVSRKTSKVLSIFLKAGTAAPAQDQPDLIGLPLKEILSRYGKPDLEGGDLTLATGDYVGRWFSYETGIGFHFDHQGRVKTVSVFATKRKRQKQSKGITRHIRSYSKSVAALRHG